MPITMVEGWDYYPDAAGTTGIGLNSRWILSGDYSGAGSLVAGRFEGKALRLTAAGGDLARSRVFGDSAELTLRYAIRITENSEGPNVIMRLAAAGGGTGFQLRVNEFGLLDVMVGEVTIIGTTTKPLILNSWHSIGIELEYKDENGRIRIEIDSEEQFEFTGDTKIGSSTSLAIIRFLADAGNLSQSVDDLYIFTGESILKPECRIQLLDPLSDFIDEFDPLTGVDNFAMVDDASTDSDTTYNSSNTVGDRDLFNLTQVTVNPSQIIAVATIMAARKEDSGARIIQSVLKSGPAEASGADSYLASSYSWIDDFYVTDPNTGVSWVKSGVNALKGGYELVL